MEHLVLKIFQRISNLVQNATVKNIKEHSRNICFLVAAVAKVSRSLEVRKAAVDLIVAPCVFRLSAADPLPDAVSAWLHCDFGHSQMEFPISEYDREELYNQPYSVCTNTLVNYFVQSLSGCKTAPAFWQNEYACVLFSKWAKDDFKFDQLRAADTHLIYFVTHFVMVGNHYSNANLAADIFTRTLKEKLFALFDSWYHQLLPKADENTEIFYEVCYCLIVLNCDESFQLPKTFFQTYQTVLDLCSNQPVTAAFFPKKTRYSFSTDTHANLVVAMFITEANRYLSKQSGPFQFPVYQNPLLSLQKTGLVVCKTEIEEHLAGLAKILENFVEIYPGDDVVLNVQGASVSVVTPANIQTNMNNLEYSSYAFENLMRHVQASISTHLGLERKKIVVFEDMVYLRRKRGKAFTKAHSDFYHFVAKTDKLTVFDKRKYAEQDKEDKKCVLCRKNKKNSSTFDFVCLCPECADKPIHLYTIWISLAEYTKIQLLEFYPGPHSYSNLDKKTFRRETPVPENQMNFFSPVEKMCQGDALLFNCKNVHRLQKSSSGLNSRMSVDIRFAILN
jgi:hypothetical protein